MAPSTIKKDHKPTMILLKFAVHCSEKIKIRVIYTIALYVLILRYVLKYFIASAIRQYIEYRVSYEAEN